MESNPAQNTRSNPRNAFARIISRRAPSTLDGLLVLHLYYVHGIADAIYNLRFLFVIRVLVDPLDE